MSLEIDWTRRKLWTAEMIEAERARLDLEVYGLWGKKVEVERRRRIRIAVATYAYEIADAPIMDDYDWDRLAGLIDRWFGTRHPLLDEFFIEEFTPVTGMWIHQHPELEGIERIYHRMRTYK